MILYFFNIRVFGYKKLYRLREGVGIERQN